MVLATARAVARHEQDAEDAFQATFLTLASRAGSVRGGSSLAAWLHRVAYRSAVAASRAARRRREVEGASLHQPRGTAPPADPDLAATVRAEVARLPEVNRLPVVLCDLEGLTYLEAAARLGWTEPTLRNRLAQARARLKTQFARRGYADLAMPLAWGWTPTRSVVPAPLLRTTLALALGRITASTTVLSIAQALARGMIAMQSWKLLAAALLVASTVGAVGYATVPPNLGAEAPARSAAPSTPAPPQPLGDDAVVRGRVIDPTGQPVAGAEVFVASDFPLPSPSPTIATTADGRFELPIADPLWKSFTERKPSWVVARAAGFGGGWASLVDPAKSADVRLVADASPIEGQVLDEVGRPVVGAKVVTRSLLDPRLIWPDEDAEDALVEFARTQVKETLRNHPRSLAVTLTATTGADGWFSLPRLGPDRVVLCEISGSTFTTTEVVVITRDRVENFLGDPLAPKRFRAEWFQFRRFTLIVPPTRIVAGVVRDRDSGQPLGHGKIDAIGSYRGGEVAIAGVTDAQGRYCLVGLPESSKYSFTFQPAKGQPYMVTEFKHQPEPGREPVTIDLILQRAALVRGRITDKRTGQPVTGLVQPLPCPGSPDQVGFPGFDAGRASYRLTDDDGRYELAVPPGRSLIAFQAFISDCYRTGQGAERLPGYDPETRRLPPTEFHASILTTNYDLLAEINTVPGAEATPLDLQIDPKGTIALTVLDTVGDPVGETTVQGISDESPDQVQTRKQARVILQGFQAPTSSQRISVWHQGRKLAGSMIVTPAKGWSQTLKLVPWGEVRGRVIQLDGTPWRNASLLAGPRAGPIAPILGGANPAGVQTDADGRFHLVGLIPGMRYTASLAEHGEITVGDLIIEPGEVKDLGDVQVHPLPPRPAEAKIQP